MFKKNKNVIILCIMAVAELIVLFVYFSMRESNINWEGASLNNILETVNSFYENNIVDNLYNLIWKVLPTIITLFGVSFYNGVRNFIKIKCNWKNRSAIKYTLIRANENVDFKELLLNYARLMFEIVGLIICVLVCVGIAHIMVAFLLMSEEIKCVIALAIVFVIGILRGNEKVNRNKFLILGLYGIIGSLGLLFVTELYTNDTIVIVRFACISTLMISFIVYCSIYHFLLISNVKRLPTYMFIITRGILLIGSIIGIFIAQSFCAELYNLWFVLMIVESIGQLWIWKKDFGDIIIQTQNGDTIKAKKNVIQYENEKLGYIDQQGNEVLCENKIIDYIYYQSKVSSRYEKKLKKKNRKVICCVEGKKPLVGQKYHAESDWIFLENVEGQMATLFYIPMNAVKKVVYHKA